MKKPKIAVIGASISGCATAIILDRADQDVTIFEQREKNAMYGRGAGVTLPRELIAKLIDQDLFDKDFPAIDINEKICYSYDKDKDCERLITSGGVSAASMHWENIYQNLVKRIPVGKIYYNAKVSEISTANIKKIRLMINRQWQEFDLVIFADGYDSIGRNFLFSDICPRFVDYIAWRGTVSHLDRDITKHFDNKLSYYGYEHGHLLIYPIPSSKATKQKDDLVINWLIYETINDHHPLFGDKKAQKNIAPTEMTPAYIAYLHKLTVNNFPSFVCKLITNTKAPHTQAIYETLVPAYFANNIALVGDASILLRPHAGSGAAKALDDALSLKMELDQERDIFIVMDHWGKIRQQFGAKLFNVSQALGEFLVTKIPAWEKLDRQTLDDLWNKVLTGHQWYITSQK